MTKSTLFVTVLVSLFAACASESSEGWGLDTGSTCEPLCYGDAPCNQPCSPVAPASYDMRVISVVDLNEVVDRPSYQVFVSDHADPVFLSDGYDGRTAPVELMKDTFIVIELDDGECVMPAAQGVLTCTTDRYELALEVR